MTKKTTQCLVACVVATILVATVALLLNIGLRLGGPGSTLLLGTPRRDVLRLRVTYENENVLVDDAIDLLGEQELVITYTVSRWAEGWLAPTDLVTQHSMQVQPWPRFQSMAHSQRQRVFDAVRDYLASREGYAPSVMVDNSSPVGPGGVVFRGTRNPLTIGYIMNAAVVALAVAALFCAASGLFRRRQRLSVESGSESG